MTPTSTPSTQNTLISAQVPNEPHSLVEEQGRAGQRNQTHYHRHYYDGDQLHMRWETATPEKRIGPMVDPLPCRPFLNSAGGGRRGVRGDDLDAREKRLEARKSGRRRPVDVRNSVRNKLKNSVAFSGNAQTAAVRLRHAFKRHARRGVSAGGGALCRPGIARHGRVGRGRRRRADGRGAGAGARRRIGRERARGAARRGAGERRARGGGRARRGAVRGGRLR